MHERLIESFGNHRPLVVGSGQAIDAIARPCEDHATHNKQRFDLEALQACIESLPSLPTIPGAKHTGSERPGIDGAILRRRQAQHKRIGQTGIDGAP